MPNLKDIRRRIKSVKNTQKITQAMRMVAAAKVKRAEARMKAARPYAATLLSVFAQVMQAITQADGASYEEARYAGLLQAKPTTKRVALLIISSDRGLCGSFNAQLLRQLDVQLADYAKQGVLPRIYCVGNKAIQAVKQRYADLPVVGRLGGMSASPSIHDAKTVSDALLNLLQEGSVDTVDVLSTRFKSMMSYKAEVFSLFPLALENEEAPASKATKIEVAAPKAEWLIEPNPGKVLDEVLPMYLTQTIYARMLESAASELAARMAAMASATDNAKAMLQTLTLQYNKARQAAITQELMEIVGGAEALA
jgi:F-type H+-transporting ATPase subunit gamma